jgi:NADPH2:quinone reductase
MGAPDFMQEQWAEVAALLADGSARVIEGPAYDLSDARQALLDMDARTLTGKALLTVRGE